MSCAQCSVFQVSVIKAKLNEMLNMPAGKQKLQLEVSEMLGIVTASLGFNYTIAIDYKQVLNYSMSLVFKLFSNCS